MNKITRIVDVELRASDSQDEQRVDGYAVVFNAETDLGWFTEEIDRNAFNEADMSDVYLLFNHDENNVLAGTLNGSTELKIDDTGLFQSSNIVDTSLGKDTFKLVKKGLIRKMSFAFTIAKDGEEWLERNGKEHRIIRKIDKLFDVSLVTYPAYSQTSAYARSKTDELAEEHKRRREQEKKLERILSNGKSIK